MKKKHKKVVNEEELVKNKAYFYQRLFAYILDMFIVSMLASILAQPFIDLKATEKETSVSICCFFPLQIVRYISIEFRMERSLFLKESSASKKGLLGLE